MGDLAAVANRGGQLLKMVGRQDEEWDRHEKDDGEELLQRELRASVSSIIPRDEPSQPKYHREESDHHARYQDEQKEYLSRMALS